MCSLTILPTTKGVHSMPQGFRKRALSVFAMACVCFLMDPRLVAANIRCYSKPRFTINGSNVLDSATGLTWQQKASAQTFNNAQARNYCSGLGSGWRLPTILELMNLSDDNLGRPALSPAFTDSFPDADSYFFWSATPVSGDIYYWLVSFEDGASYYGDTALPHRARCVR
jgi:hypothetical protein